MSMTATQIIRDPAQLEAIATEWWALWRRCPASTPFQCPGWLLAWWRAFSPGELFTVTCTANGRLRGIAPLYLESGPQGRRLLPLGISVSDYGDVLIEAGSANSVGAALVAAIAAEGGWDHLQLCDLAQDAAALSLPAAQACEIREYRASPCPVLWLPDRGEQTEQMFPARKRRQLRMAWHRAERRGPVAVVQADAGSAAAVFDELVRLHAARWHSRAEPGVLADPCVQNFHRQAIGALAAEGLLRLYALRIAGRVAAVYYGFQHRQRAFAYLGGFEPDFAFESPGTILLGHAIAASVREGAKEFHFLRGSERYKYEWGAEDRWTLSREFRRKPLLAHA
jgi:CelD/BcsL family acetyltransferase involved in cellulose biosynthesis